MVLIFHYLPLCFNNIFETFLDNVLGFQFLYTFTYRQFYKQKTAQSYFSNNPNELNSNSKT